jgi:hypothetical protein
VRIEKKHIKWAVAVIFVLAALFVLLVMTSETGPTKEQAIRFNNNVVKDYRDIIAADDSCIEMMRYDVYNMDSSVFRLQKVVEKKTIKYASMPVFDEKDTLRKAFIHFLKIYNEVAFVDYPKMVIHFELTKNKAIEANNTYKIFIRDIDYKVSEAKNDFFVAQKEFKIQYKINTEE